jgi:hypothetical protein
MVPLGLERGIKGVEPPIQGEGILCCCHPATRYHSRHGDHPSPTGRPPTGAERKAETERTNKALALENQQLKEG